MTGFRLLCCLCFCLLVFSSVGFAKSQEKSAAPTLSQLQLENTALQRKVKRLEAQVTAMRDEMNAPDASQIFAGLGYIVGIFGIAGWIAARKRTGRED